MIKQKFDVKCISAYEVRGQNDTTEGRGGTYLVGYFFNKTTADEAAKDKGVWGSPGLVKAVAALAIEEPDGSYKYYLDNPIEIKSMTPEEMLAKAKKKLKDSLTSEEIETLGIKL
jgi:hypothetical protein